MTVFQSFTGDFAKRTITMFGDFSVDTTPFSTGTSTTGDVASVSNTNNPTTYKGSYGVLSLTTPTAVAVAEHRYCGVYMAAPVAAGVTVDKQYFAGRGTLDMSARMWKTTATVDHMITFGLSSFDHSTSTVPSTDFAGFYAHGNDGFWRMAVVNNGVASTFNTSVVYDPSIPATLRVFIDDAAENTSFYINGKHIKTIRVPLRKTIGMVPLIEVKDLVATGALIASIVSIDYLMIQQDTKR